MQSQVTPSEQDQDTALYRATLHELIELGTTIARDIAAQAARDTQALATNPDAPRPDHTIAFDRVARTVRRCILLAQHLRKDTDQRDQTRTQARIRVLRSVDDAIAKERTPGKAALHTELRERLDAPDLVETMDHDLDTRPLPEIIQELRRDLGLANMGGADPWPRRTLDDIRALHHDARHRAPGTHTVVRPSQAPGADTPAPPRHAPAAPPQPPPSQRWSGSPAAPG